MANWFTRLFSGPVLAESAPAKADPNLPRKVVVQTSPVGSSGTDIYSGYYHEEYLRELQGRPAADIYDRMRRSDPRVKMCLSAVKNPIKGATWEIDPAGDDDAAKAHADLVRHALFEDMDKSWKEFLSEALSFVDFGHSVFEVVHKVVRDNPRYGSYNGIQSFGFRSQRTIERWNLEKTGQLKSITQMAYGDLESHKDIPGQFLVVFSLEKEGDNYEGISALRTCYGPFFRKDLYLKLMAIGIEKTAVPTPKAKIPSGQQTSEQYANLIATLEAYTSHQQNYITYPEGWDINFDQTKFDASGVKSAIEFEDAQMVFSFLANFLNLGQSGAGSFALSVDLSDFFLAGIEHVADIVTEKFNRQIIPDLIKLNFGPQENYPKLKCSGISDKPGGELGKLLKDLAESKYITPDDRLEKHLRKRIGLPEVSEEGKREVGPTAPATFSDVKKKPKNEPDMKPVDAALSYAKLGWHVVPDHTVLEDGQCSCDDDECRSPGKHPRIEEGKSDGSTDPALIRTWWTKWPEANVAIVCGAPSGIVAVDVDPRNDGFESLEELQDSNDPLPRTVTSLSGGGGLHLLFRHPKEEVIRNRVGLRPGIDVKADRGRIVAPPSNHVSGKRYQWKKGCSPDQIELAELPDWLLDMVQNEQGTGSWQRMKKARGE